MCRAGAGQERDLLFGVVAVQMGAASAEQVMAAAGAWATDRSRGLAARLVDGAKISASRVNLIEALVAESVALHGGDAGAALQSFGGDAAVHRSFGGALSSAPDEDEPREVGEVTDEVPGRYEPVSLPSLASSGPDAAEIGRGGIGRVLRVRDRHLGRDIAVKELLPELPGSAPPSFGETSPQQVRLVREARVTGLLEHPNVVPVHELGRRGDGTLYYTMKLVRGRTLREALAQADSLPGRLALLDRFLDVCQAVAYAHSKGVMHRDIKPDNIMLGEFGETLLLDWGLARVRGTDDIRASVDTLTAGVGRPGEHDSARTLEGEAIGTPAYMSPEQAEGNVELMDERSDVWGLGAVLFELLTGRPPFEGVNAYEVVGRVMTDPVPKVPTLAPEAPSELAAIVDKALQRERDARYPSAAEFAAEIDTYLQGGRVGAYAYSTADLLRRVVARNKGVVTALAVLLAVVLVGSGVVLRAWKTEQRARESAVEARAGEREARLRSEESELQAQARLSLAYTDKAAQLLGNKNYLGASVLAAAAREQSPFPGGGRAALSEGVPFDVEEARALDLRIASTWFAAHNRGRLEIERYLEAPDESCSRLAYSPARPQRLFGVCGNVPRLTLFDLESGEPIKRSAETLGAEWWGGELAVSGDAQRILTVDGPRKRLRLWDAETFAPLDLPPGLPPRITRARWTPRGRGMLLVDDEGHVFVHGGDGAPRRLPLTGVMNIEVSPQGDVIAARASGALHLHRLGEAKPFASSTRVKTGIKMRRPVFSPDGSLLALSEGNRVAVLDTRTGEDLHLLDSDETPLQLAFLDDATLAAATMTTGRLWNARSGELLEVFRAHNAAVGKVLPVGPGRLVTAGVANGVRLWRVRARPPAWRLPGKKVARHLGIAFVGEERVLWSPSGLGSLTLQHLRDEVPAFRFVPKGAPTLVGVVAPEARRLLSLNDGRSATLFDLDTGAPLRELEVPTTRRSRFSVGGALLTRDGKRLLAAVGDVMLQEFDLETGERLAAYPAGNGMVTGVALSADERWLAIGDAFGTLSLWDRRQARRVYTIAAHDNWLTGIAFSPEGDRIFTGGVDAWVRMFSREDGAQLWESKGHAEWINRVAWSPDGSVLASASDDKTLRLWAPETGRPLLRYPLRSNGGDVRFSPSGEQLVVMDGRDLQFIPPRGGLVPLALEAALHRASANLEGFEIRGRGQSAAEAAAEMDPRVPEKISLGFTRLVDMQPIEGEGTLTWLAPSDLAPLAQSVTASLADARVDPPAIRDAAWLRLSLPDANTHYVFSPLLEPGRERVYADVFDAAMLEQLVAEPVDATGVHLLAWVIHGPHPKPRSMTGVGCAEVSIDSGAPPRYLGLDESWRPALLDRKKGTRTESVVLFSGLEAGRPHRLTARAGTATTALRIPPMPAGATATIHLVFDPARFPDDPTPADCIRD